MKALCITLCCVFLLCGAATSTTIHYVNLNSTNPVPPYTNLISAADNIQDAVDAAAAGDTVMIADGHYLLSSAISVSNAIAVQSLNGPEATVVDGQGTNRCFHLENVECMIIGLTITNGHVSPSVPFSDRNGGGVYCESTAAVISNCWIAGNQNASGKGGGVYQGTLKDCMISNNTADSGGGLYGSIVHGCIIRGNMSRWGGGMFEGRAAFCTFSQNHAEYAGGGALDIEAVNCIFSENHAESGGGANVGMYINCTVVFNTADVFGGGIVVGGFAYSGPSPTAGVQNSIIWSNTAPDIPNIPADEWNVSISYSCAPEIAHGVDGNITNAPAFVNPAGGDLRLLATSPCIDTGSNDHVATALDLDGNPRRVDGDFDGVATVDMGAYEYQVMMMSAATIHVPPINLKSKGRCPVKIQSTDAFNVADLDPASVRFAGASPVSYRFGEQKGDGCADLMLHFLTSKLEIDSGDTSAMLIGQTRGGTLVVAKTAIRTVPDKKRK